MRVPGTIVTPALLLAAAISVFADKPPLDCGKKSLSAAVANAGANETIVFTGVCPGPVEIRTDGLMLQGVGRGDHRRRGA